MSPNLIVSEDSGVDLCGNSLRTSCQRMSLERWVRARFLLPIPDCALILYSSRDRGFLVAHTDRRHFGYNIITMDSCRQRIISTRSDHGAPQIKKRTPHPLSSPWARVRIQKAYRAGKYISHVFLTQMVGYNGESEM